MANTKQESLLQAQKTCGMILQQLGGKHFIRSTGASNMQLSGTGLRFTLPNFLSQRQINRVIITPGAKEGFFTMDFTRKSKGADGKSIETPVLCRTEIPPHLFQEIFTQVTGLTIVEQA